MKRFKIHESRQIIVCLLFCFIFINTKAQSNLVESNASHVALTRIMIDHYISIYEYLLEIKLNRQQQNRMLQGIVDYWNSNNPEAIQQIISDLKYYGKREELESLRSTGQETIVEAFRKDGEDPVAKVLLEAFDSYHPDKISKTAPKNFNDIIGEWKTTDALVAERSYSTQPAGISYTDTEILEVNGNRKFKRVKVHSHYSGNCRQVDGLTEYGALQAKNNKLVFQVQSGSELITDNCSPSLNRNIKRKPHTEIFTWSIRSNINKPGALMLCLNKQDGTAVCLDRQ